MVHPSCIFIHHSPNSAYIIPIHKVLLTSCTNMSLELSNQALVLYEPIDLSLKLNNIMSYSVNVKNNKRTRCAYENDQGQEVTVRAKKLKKFKYYTLEEEIEEKINGVCTKLKLYDDPWKIKKVLETSDVNSLCRLMISKRLVHQHIVKVWERAGRYGDVKSLGDGSDVRVKVWDCNRGKEYVLTMKKHGSTDCYILCGNWRKQFVSEKRLKKGDEIGLFWCNLSESFFFSVLAVTPHHQPVCYLVGR